MKKKILPLVTCVFSALLIIGSVNLYNLNARENDKLKSSEKMIEKVTNNISNKSGDNIDSNNEFVNDSGTKEVEKNIISSDDKKVDKSKKIEDNKVTSNNSTNTTKDSKEVIKLEESKKENDSTRNESTSANKSETVYQITDENSKDKNNGSQDPEYLKIKASCEFFTRAECQAALDNIMDRYITDEHPVVRSSCESFAYKGEIVGYRVLLTYGDGNYFYNN